MQYIIQNAGLIFGVLWSISEALALIPGVQSNSVFQLIYNGLKALSGLFKQTPPADPKA